jgi:hypothetical protein
MPTILDLARNLMKRSGSYAPEDHEIPEAPTDILGLARRLAPISAPAEAGVDREDLGDRAPAIIPEPRVGSTPKVSSASARRPAQAKTEASSKPAPSSASLDLSGISAPEGEPNELLMKAIVAAVPTLIGAAFGNRGGEIGAKAGGDTLVRYDTEKKDKQKLDRELKKDAFDQSAKVAGLRLQQDGLRIREKGVDVSEKIGTQRNQIASRSVDVNEKLGTERNQTAKKAVDVNLNIGTERNQIAKENVEVNKQKVKAGEKKAEDAASKGKRKEARDFQQDFNRDPVTKKYVDAATIIPELKREIMKGSGQALKAVQFKLATLYNGARPTDADVQAFRGGQAVWDKFTRAIDLAVNDDVTEKDRKELLSLVSGMEQEAKDGLKTSRDKYVRQAAARGLGEPEELNELLAVDPLLDQMGGEDAEKEALINEILGEP